MIFLMNLTAHNFKNVCRDFTNTSILLNKSDTRENFSKLEVIDDIYTFVKDVVFNMIGMVLNKETE